MSEKRFYHDAHWIKMQHKGYTQIVANVFSSHDAKIIVDLLNELFPYKLLVRKHKQDLEAIYGKSIKKQLEEVDSE